MPVTAIRASQALDIAGAAAVLRADAISLSSGHQVPATLGGWYGAIVEYSGARHDIAVMYAGQVYRVLRNGLTATAPGGEVVQIAPTAVTPDTATASNVATTAPALPANCTSNPGTDYAPAYNCIVPASYAGVTYDTANRPSDLPLLAITVHDTEETLDNTIAIFWNQSKGVSVHYVVDTDGTVYQCLHEKEVAFQNGNFWYNQRTIGIEDVGVDATGYQWYNATEYLGSAKLAAYLLTKYGIPLDHEHVMSHGTTPAPSLGTSPSREVLWNSRGRRAYRALVAQGHAQQRAARTKTVKLAGNGELRVRFRPLTLRPTPRKPLRYLAAENQDQDPDLPRPTSGT